MTLSVENSRKLASLLIAAAGLESNRVKTLTCHVKRDAPAMFTAELIGEDETIGEALAKFEIQEERV